MHRAIHRRAVTIAVLTLVACAPAQRPAADAHDAVSLASSHNQKFDANGFSLRIELAPHANLLYQLDCLSGSVMCSPEGYRALWSKLGLDAKDQDALVRWKRLRTRHTGTVRADDAAFTAPLLVSGARMDLAERQRIAGLRARDRTSFEASVALVSNDADARALREISMRFEPRFMRFWRGAGLAAGAAYVQDLASELRDPFLSDTLARVARFIGFSPENGEIFRIHLVVQPETENPRLTAYQLETDFVIEAPAKGKARAVLDVITHELCHALVFRMPSDAKRALVEAFMDAADPQALLDYGMFDEALAASVGQGLVWRHYFPTEDLARHAARGFGLAYKPAGALAAALLPHLEELLNADARLGSPAFVQALSEAARSSYREHGPQPIDYLHSHVLAAAPPLASAAALLRDAAFAGFPYLREFPELDAEARAYITDHTFINAAVFVPSFADVATLLTELQLPPTPVAELRKLDEDRRGLVYALPRTPKTYLFVFVAPDPATADALARRFIALREMRDGLLVEL